MKKRIAAVLVVVSGLRRGEMGRRSRGNFSAADSYLTCVFCKQRAQIPAGGIEAVLPGFLFARHTKIFVAGIMYNIL